MAATSRDAYHSRERLERALRIEVLSSKEQAVAGRTKVGEARERMTIAEINALL